MICHLGSSNIRHDRRNRLRRLRLDARMDGWMGSVDTSRRRIDAMMTMTMRASVTTTRVTTPTTSRGRRGAATTTTTRAGATFEVPSQYTKVTPCGAGVLVKVAAAETVTKGGIVLTETAQRKPTSGTYLIAGGGRRQGRARSFPHDGRARARTTGRRVWVARVVRRSARTPPFLHPFARTRNV